MTAVRHDFEGRWWFKLSVPLLAIISTIALFNMADLALYGPSFISANTVIYGLCWWALERFYRVVIGALMAIGKPGSSSASAPLQ